jgi:hypothetical protein
MNKKWFLIVLAIAIVALGAYASLKKQSSSGFDPLNTSYMIEGKTITFVNGAADTTTKLFGQPTLGDLDHDGKTDAAIILVQQPGGSGTFYYVAAAMNTASGAKGTNAILLGDRIAPQNIGIMNGQIVVNYADRKPGEPMSTQPSVGVTKYISFDGTALVEASPIAGPGERCGGNMTTAPVCITGYHCGAAPGQRPFIGDIGGICIKN